MSGYRQPGEVTEPYPLNTQMWAGGVLDRLDQLLRHRNGSPVAFRLTIADYNAARKAQWLLAREHLRNQGRKTDPTTAGPREYRDIPLTWGKDVVVSYLEVC